MIIEIDQSGKVENTDKDTVIAFANEINKSLLIKAKDKREIQRIFRQIGKPRIFIYKLFSILIFLLVKSYLKKIDEIIIDEEYPDKSALIKNFLLQKIREVQPGFPAENVEFRKIDKKSKAHDIAYNVFKEKRKADILVEDKDILKFILSK